MPAARGFAAGRARKRRGAAGIGEIDAAGIEIDVAIEDDVNGRAAREFQFRAAREKHGSESDRRAGAGSYARALGALSGDGSDGCANSGRFRNGSGVTALVRIAVNIPFLSVASLPPVPALVGTALKSTA